MADTHWLRTRRLTPVTTADLPFNGNGSRIMGFGGSRLMVSSETGWSAACDCLTGSDPYEVIRLGNVVESRFNV